MKLIFSALAMSTLFSAAAFAAPKHICADLARTQAAALLKLHMGDADMKGDISNTVTVKPPVKALRGKGKFDVLETTGYVYKAQYRIRMIYAMMPKDLGEKPEERCTLMGQEILEIANPF